MQKKPRRVVRSWAAWSMGLLFGVAALSQARLQTVGRAETLEKADATNRFVLTRKEHAKRGAILASDGRTLASDEDAYELNVQFDKVPHSEAFYMALGEATGLPASEFQGLAESGVGSRAWRQPVSQTQADAVAKVRSDWRADGVSLARVDRRAYPLGAGASGIVGLLREGEPLLGLEKQQDPFLAGKDGKRVGLTDKRGAFLPMRLDPRTTSRQDGQSITLTIDTELQAVAAAEIRKAVTDFKAVNGVAMVMDPKTGDVLAAANWPSFEPYQADGTPAPIKVGTDVNPMTMLRFEPGSTFKVLTLAKALDADVITPTSHLFCPGFYHPTSRTTIHCDSHHGNRAHGDVDITKAIAKSCNVAAATWAQKIKYDPFIQYINDLGLLRPSTLGLPQESSGSYNRKETAHDIQLATIGFGQSITCTPVGLIGAFGALANDGIRMEPRLIKKIGDQEQPVGEGHLVFKPETTHIVQNCMEAVMQSGEGTGFTLRVPGYRLGGKTGTAQKINHGMKGYVSNFVGFVPSKSPRAVVLVMVNDPKNAYYGATVAGPTFQHLAEAIIRRYAIPPTEPLEIKAPHAEKAGKTTH